MSFSWRGVAIPYHRLPKIASSSEGSCHVMEGSFTLITQSQATTLGSDAWIKCWRVSILEINLFTSSVGIAICQRVHGSIFHPFVRFIWYPWPKFEMFGGQRVCSSIGCGSLTLWRAMEVIQSVQSRFNKNNFPTQYLQFFFWNCISMHQHGRIGCIYSSTNSI